MYCAIFIIAAALPSLILAKDAKVKNPPFPCNNDTEVTGAGDKFFQCFTDMVEHKQNNTHKDCKEIKSTLATYYMTVANASCYKNNNQSKITDPGVFLNNLMDYSLNHNAFDDFVANGGPVCINNVKENINKCLMSSFGVIKNDDKYYKLWRKAAAGINITSCNKAKELKECVLSAIKSSKTCINETKVLNVASYVNSLFEFTLVRCAILVPAAPTTGPADQSKQTRTHPTLQPPTKASGNVTALLGVILALVLISMLYVVIRDCRGSRGKTWNPETMPMTSRSGN